MRERDKDRRGPGEDDDETSAPEPCPAFKATAALAFFILAHSQLAMAQAPIEDGMSISHDLAYGPLPEQRLDIYKPSAFSGPIPGVIVIHGGGWTGGDKEAMLPICRMMARAGLLGATINYRLATNKTTANQWPAPLIDAQLAVRWLRAHAAETGLDKSRLCAFGESAGSHLAVFLAVRKTNEPEAGTAAFANESPSVLCAVDNFGPVDLSAPGPRLQRAAELLVGRRLDPDHHEAFEAASPQLQVTKDTGSIFIEQGISDQLVEPSQSWRLAEALFKNGVPFRFVSYPGGHSWVGLTDAERSAYLAEERLYLLDILLPKGSQLPQPASPAR